MENENNENIEQLHGCSMQDNFVSVKIFGQDVYLKITDVSKEYLEDIAKYIDETINVIKDSHPHFNDKMILTLAALNIADMLHRKESENNEERQCFSSYTNRLHEKTVAIIQMIDDRKNEKNG